MITEGKKKKIKERFWKEEKIQREDKSVNKLKRKKKKKKRKYIKEEK